MGVGLVLACHPLPALAVTLIACGLAVSSGGTPGEVATVTAAVLAGQLSVGWLNDLVDADRDVAVGRSDKPVVTGLVSRPALLVGVVVVAPVALALSLALGRPVALVHLVGLAFAWSYNLGLKSTAFSVVPYAVFFGLLPAVVALGLAGGRFPPTWLVVGAALLGCAAHFVNVLPDLVDDLSLGVRGLPHRLGARRSAVAAALLALAASVVLVLGPRDAPSSVGWVALPLTVIIVVLGLALGRRPGSRMAFNAVLAVAMIDVVLILAAGVPTT